MYVLCCLYNGSANHPYLLRKNQPLLSSTPITTNPGFLPVFSTQCTMERKYHFLRVCFLAFGCVSLSLFNFLRTAFAPFPLLFKKLFTFLLWLFLSPALFPST